MRPLHENLAGRLLCHLAHALEVRPAWFLIPQVLLFAAAVYVTVTRLEFSTSRNDLISSEDRHRRNFLNFQREFRAQESLVAIVESGDPEKNRAFVERLAARLRREPELFANVYFKGDLRLMGSKALLFLPEPALEELRRVLVQDRALIQTFSQSANLNAILEQVCHQFRLRARAPAGETPPDADAMAGALPALQRMIDQAAVSVQQAAVLPAPGVAALFGNDGDEGGHGLYLTFAGGRIYVVAAEARDARVEPAAIRRLGELVRETQQELPGVNAGITGEPVLKQDEMLQARRDTDKAAVVSLVLSVLIFIYAYREIRRPLMAAACLIFGIGYTLGFATVAVGRLNLLSLTLVPILIGLGIDFGVHLITRYEEELRRGSTPPTAVRKALTFSGLGIITSGFTTAGAFFAMTLTNFKGIREMGLISGVGLLVCLVPMMTLLPWMLVRGRRAQPSMPVSGPARVTRRERIERIYLDRPRIVLACGVVLTVFSLTQMPGVRFDYNLLNLQTRGLPAVRMEQKLIESASQSLLYCAVIAGSLPEAVELERRIRELPSVASVVSMVKFLTEDQEGKLARVREIKAEVAAIPVAVTDLALVDLHGLNQTLFALRGYLGLGIKRMEGEGGDARLAAQLHSLRDSVDTLRAALSAGGAEAVNRLTVFQQGLFKDFLETLSIIRLQDDRGRLQVEDLPEFLRDRFISAEGRYFLQVYPKEDVWQREHQERFVQELRSVAPDVTGSPVQFYEYTSMLKDNFQRAAAYAGAAIAAFVFLHFRRIGSVVLAFLPVVLGSCWTLGWMGWFGIPFNPVNIMALALVIGIGVTNGIHILNRFAEEAHPSILARSTGKAVLVSALTTMAGFGSLMVARHQGIASLGQVMVVGTGMCMLASLAFLPAVLNLLHRIGWTMIRPRRRRVVVECEPRDAGAGPA